MVQEAARAMKTFGKRERDGTPTRLPALTPRRDAKLPALTPRRDEAPDRATRDASFAARTSYRAD